MLPTRTLADAAVAASYAARRARAAGFDRRAATEIGIVASELVTNDVRHARGRGHLTVVADRDGIEVTCVSDDGDGARVAARYLRPHDGHDVPVFVGQPAGLGCGVAAVVRLMDEVTATPRVGGGVTVRARRRHAAGPGARR